MAIEFAFPMSQLPWRLALAALCLAGLAYALWAFERRRAVRLDRFVDLGLVPRLRHGAPPGARRPLFWLPLLGFVGLAAALAQPRWGEDWQEVRKQSHDVIICLDTSESMRADDVLPSRMDRAKLKIEALLDRASGDRFGLVAFAGAAALECPFTLDHGYVKAVLHAMDTDTISLEGTDIAAALQEATAAFEDVEAHGNPETRAILLVTDGEQGFGDAVAAAEEAARVARVYVLGVGEPEGAEVALPDWMARYVRAWDASQPHLSRLDEAGLSRVAAAGRGRDLRATPDNADVEALYGMVSGLPAREVGDEVRLRLVNRYQWPLALAVLCFAAEGAWLVLLPRLRDWRPAGVREQAALEGEDPRG